MALSKIDVANMLTGVTPVANGGTAATTLAGAGLQRPTSKPIIINGDCSVAQRGTANADESTSGIYRVDRMNVGLSSIGEFRMSQESLSSGAAYNAGFKKAFRIDCAVADASPASSDIGNMTYKIEGRDVQVFKKGTSSAETYTLAFWVKSNKTGTAQVNLVDADNSRMVSANYTISSANTWEHKVLNYPADTTGAFDNDANKSLEIEWALDAGSDFTSGAVPSAWESQANADRSVNDLALQDNTANDWAITGIQLEVGTFSSTTLPPFQFESFEDNLARCLRYFYCPNMNGESYTSIGQGGGYNSSRIDVPVFFPVPMREAPSVSLSGGTAIRFEGNAEDITGSAISIGNVATTTGDVFNNSLSGVNQGYAYRLYLNDSGTTKMFFNSEL